MHENELARKVKSLATAKLLISFALILAAAVLVYLMVISKLFSENGFTKPIDLHSSISNLNIIVNRPLTLGTCSVSLQAEADGIVDTGIVKKNDGVIEGYYYAAYVDGKYVLCYVSPDKRSDVGSAKEYTFTGSLEAADTEVVSMVVSDIMKDTSDSKSDAQNMLYPYSIDTTDNGMPFRFILYGFTLILAVFGLILALKNLPVVLDVRRYAPFRKLAKYGDVESMLEEVQAECANALGNSEIKFGRAIKAVLTRNWIVVHTPTSIKIIRAEDLLWAYLSNRTTTLYMSFKVTVVHFVKFRSRNGTITVPGEELCIDSLLHTIHEKYPHVTVGYSARLEALWNSGADQFEAQSRGFGS